MYLKKEALMALSKSLRQSWAMVAPLIVSLVSSGCSAPGFNPDDDRDSGVVHCSDGTVIFLKTMPPGTAPVCPDSSTDAREAAPAEASIEASVPDAETGPDAKPDAGHDADADADADVVDPIDAPDTADTADTQDVPDVAPDAPDASVDADATTDVADTADAASEADATITDTSEASTPDADASLPETGTDAADAADVADVADVADATVTSFTCGDWTVDDAYSALTLGGDKLFASGGAKSFGPNDMYATGGTSAYSDVLHWDGLSWSWQNLTPAPGAIRVIDGVSGTDVWAVGLDGSQGLAYHRGMDMKWRLMTTPNARAYVSVYAPVSGEAFLLGNVSGVGPAIWHTTTTGAAWSAMSLPILPPNSTFYGMWGRSAKSVYLTGTVWSDDGFTQTQGLLLHYDGKLWSTMAVPVDTVQCDGISGSSDDDLFLAGLKNDGTGVVHHIVSGALRASTSTVQVSMSVLSLYPGTAMALGSLNGGGAGSDRVTTIDQDATAQTGPIDDYAYGNMLLVEPDGVTVHVYTYAVGDYSARHYVGKCKSKSKF